MMMKSLIQEIKRSMVYQRSKNIEGVRPFGSLEKMYKEDFVWLNHSITPSHIENSEFKTKLEMVKIFTICQY